MKIIAISFFIIAIAYITYIAVSSIIKMSNIAHKRKEISEQSRKWFVRLSVVIGIVIVSVLPYGTVKLLEMVI